jgi:phage baseplate assembly protein W
MIQAIQNIINMNQGERVERLAYLSGKITDDTIETTEWMEIEMIQTIRKANHEIEEHQPVLK